MAAPPEPAPGRFKQRMRRARARAVDAGHTTMSWLEDHRSDQPLIDIGMRYWERDRGCDAAVIGAAVALRVFLFFVPLLLAAVGLLGFFAEHLSSKDAADDIGVSGTLANQIDIALKQSSTARWIALAVGLGGAAWAGRTLAKTLAVASRRAWALDVPHKTPTFRVIGAVAESSAHSVWSRSS